MENILTQELPSNLTFDRQAYKWKNDIISVPSLCTTLSFVNTEQGVDIILSDKSLIAPASQFVEQGESHKIGFIGNRFVDLDDLQQKQDFIAYSNAVLGDDFVSIDLECYWENAKDEWVEQRGFQYLAETDDGICDLDSIITYLIIEKINFPKREQLN
jgi:hypothetical protein